MRGEGVCAAGSVTRPYPWLRAPPLEGAGSLPATSKFRVQEGRGHVAEACTTCSFQRERPSSLTDLPKGTPLRSASLHLLPGPRFSPSALLSPQPPQLVYSDEEDTDGDLPALATDEDDSDRDHGGPAGSSGGQRAGAAAPPPANVGWGCTGWLGPQQLRPRSECWGLGTAGGWEAAGAGGCCGVAARRASIRGCRGGGSYRNEPVA
mgnify:CR=1 FL=1